MVDLLLAARISYVLGIVNLVSMSLVVLSCRCMMGVGFVNRMQEYAWYRRFYRAHCYYWWIFFLSVLFHAVLAVTAFGNPF
ncbi:hypothetical protein AKJ40_01940 [candidate division MSBL1 archaeon SCGC-AAA259M10]|uniref:Ferric oxidoreductase domain-containing protein n=3 Tax=candidate division MSBL1 TaxID=215777 RepID=A0A133U7J5_9EURY|nr:hypothetical protein AKJ62_01490 [candidate division MSBL1 archaeon SCGC-AAA259D14]KXA93721.1 hypothetical protein AKJ66_01230 [candidate division MSBL1 archaeon SCGC-AAA259E22]KXB00060.1 hypothetical protein AKJ40_01940 [candidate division MSBL1 archaeon SCGC-AAA259M10]